MQVEFARWLLNPPRSCAFGHQILHRLEILVWGGSKAIPFYLYLQEALGFKFSRFQLAAVCSQPGPLPNCQCVGVTIPLR